MAHLEVKDDFINYCNGINCDAQAKLNEILTKEMTKEEKPPLESPKEEIIQDNTDLNKLIELGTA